VGLAQKKMTNLGAENTGKGTWQRKKNHSQGGPKKEFAGQGIVEPGNVLLESSEEGGGAPEKKAYCKAGMVGGRSVCGRLAW